MFDKHPKGLVAASLANLGERFGFYTMMAILVLFLQAKFGLTGSQAGIIYATFYFLIYFLALAGGLIADKTRNYKGTILCGLVLMALGYLILAVPSDTPVKNQTLTLTVTCVGLFVIAFGNGLFKGNLQALVGQMYDDPKYSLIVEKRDGEVIPYELDLLTSNKEQTTGGRTSTGVIDAFVESIITNTPPAISGESAMHAMKVVFANEQSAQLGKAVDVQL